MSVLALIPAKQRSTGIPSKNWRRLGLYPLYRHAAQCAWDAGIEDVRISTDHPTFQGIIREVGRSCAMVIQRPPELAHDDTPMIEVVKHALTEIPGPEDKIIVLLQPTQPFRTPEHVKQAITLLQESGADSVVSVVELPRTHSPEFVLRRYCEHQDGGWSIAPYRGWQSLPTRRQDVEPAYIRDGTVYAFRRATVSRYGSIYGQDVRPLIIPPEQTCELDTEEQFAEVERRWRERESRS